MIPQHVAVLLINCPDRKGIIARVTGFLADRGGNILDLDQHTDPDTGQFFMRVAFDLQDFAIPRDAFAQTWEEVAGPLAMRWDIQYGDRRKRMAIMVSKQDHCLIDLLQRKRVGELRVDVPVIVANHPDMADVAAQEGIPFRMLPITPANKAEQERRTLGLLADAKVDFVVLARYMQIISGGFIDHYPNRIINIHHSFLPAFAGGRPYQQAYERGVKVIGATSHYVTEELDAGPIIAQQIVSIGHRDTLSDLVHKGRDLERMTLSQAVRAHIEDRVLVHQNRTIVFD